MYGRNGLNAAVQRAHLGRSVFVLECESLSFMGDSMKAHGVASLDTIQCPECGHAIPMSEALSHQIAERARAESKAEIDRLQGSLAHKEKELQEREGQLDATVEKRVAEQTAKIEEAVKLRAKGSVAIEIEDLKKRLVEASEERDVAKRAELAALRREQELDQRAKDIELEAARKVSAERQKIQEEASKRAEEQYQLKLAEKEKQIQDAKKANDELKRKLDQGSQQLQGEVLELHLEELLRSSFPHDRIDPIPKGVNGPDLIQQVFSRSGHLCGTILWESKRTKAWSDGWLPKFKEDQRKLTAEIAVLVSETLPKDCSTFVNMQGIWITGTQCAISLAAVLRMQLMQIASARAAADGAKQKSEILYEYVVGSTEFRHRVEAIAEAFIGMQIGLQEEKRATQRQWAKREKQIEQVISNTAGMYGELQGLTGLPDIPALTAGTQELEVSDDTNAVVLQLPSRVKDTKRDELPL